MLAPILGGTHYNWVLFLIQEGGQLKYNNNAYHPPPCPPPDPDMFHLSGQKLYLKGLGHEMEFKYLDKNGYF